MQLAFLILNYKNVEETVKCVGSIKNLTISDYIIVIVDNGSDDGSYQKLEKLYGQDIQIELIASDKNLGFSKGNNLGYSLIREKYDPEYVVVTNNDVLFPQKDLYKRLSKVYDETRFDVFGPDIYVEKNKEHQSPIRLNVPSLHEMKDELKMYQYYQKHPKRWVLRRRVQNIKNRLIQQYPLLDRLYAMIHKYERIDRGKVYEDVCIQGACIVISKNYLKKEEKMFSPEPFLYCEEILLLQKCREKGYKVVYDPYIQIYHKDSATMEKVNTNALTKAEFTLMHHIKARRSVIDIMKQI